MAKQLDPSEVEFNLRGSRSAVSEDWLNGQPWMLENGIDFTGKATSFRTYMSGLCAARGLAARTKLVGEDVIFQAYTPNAEQAAAKAAAVEKRRATVAANKAAGKVRKSRKSATE